MSEVKEKIIKQATKLASTIADSLSSGGDLSLDMSQEISSKVDDAVENMDIDDKVQNVLDNNDVVTEDRVAELANDAIYDHDWSTVISDQDLVYNSELDDKVMGVIDEVVDEKIESVFDAKLFSFLQGVMRKCFEDDVEAWMHAIRQQGVNKYLEEQKEKEDES